MKTFRTFRFVLFIVMTMVGLNSFGQGEATLTFTPAGSLSFDASGGEQDVTVTTENVSDWVISSVSESWVEATRSGDQIHVTVKPNSTESFRTATISVESDDLEEDKTIRVIQEAPYFDITGIRPIPASSTDKLSCNVISNARWKVEVTSSENWLQLVLPADGIGSGSGQIVLKPTGENTSTTTDRVATVTITNLDYPQKSKSYTVTQKRDETYLNVSMTSLLYNPDGATQKVSVTSNVDWNVATEGGSGWLTVTPLEGSKDGKLTVTASKNTGSATREATITITADGLVEQVIKVKQAGSGYLNVGTTSLLYNPDGATQKVSVTSNVDWNVATEGGSGWLTVTPLEGSKDGELTVTASKNAGSAPREATITITADGLVEQVIKVKQAGSGHLNVNTTSLLYNPDGGTQKVTVTSNVDWTVATEGGSGWLTVTPPNGSKDGELTVTAIKNSGSETREATITVMANGLASQVIKVKQGGSGYLNVGTTSLLYNPDGATQKVTVTSNVDWTVATEGGSGWLTVTPPNGSKDGELTVTAIKNSGSETREATITVMANGLASQVIKVKQTGSGYLNVGTTSLLYNPDGSTQKVTITSNVEWTVATEGGGDWLTVTPANGSKDGELTVTAIKNSGSETREATITVMANGLASQVIKLTQTGSGYLNVDNTDLQYNQDGSTQKITVTSNVDWTVATEGGGDWLTVTPANGSKDGELTVMAIKNTGSATREATITVTANGLPTQVIKVTQSGSGRLTVDNTLLQYNPDGSTQTVGVTSNVEWTVVTEGAGGWLTVTPTNGNGDGELTVTAIKNTGSATREATITVTANGLPTQVIKVTQSGSGRLTVDNTLLQYNPDGSTQTVGVTSNVEWTVVTEGAGGWLTVTPTNGNGNDELTVTATKNTGSEKREATITVTASGLPAQVIKVTQAGSGHLTVGKTLLEYNPDGGSEKVTVTSNLDWNVSVEGGDNWLTVTPTNGNGNDELTVTATKNTGSEKREAIITVTASGLSAQVIKVTQTTNNIFQVSDTELLFRANGSTEKDKVTITTKVAWNVSTEGGNGWLTVTPKNGNGNGDITVKADKNEEWSQRKANITISDIANVYPPQRIIVTQEGTATIGSVMCDSAFAIKDAKREIKIKPNVPWRAYLKGNSGWLTLHTPSGSENDTIIELSAKYNDTEYTRSDTLCIKYPISAKDSSTTKRPIIQHRFPKVPQELVVIPGNREKFEFTIGEAVNLKIDESEYRETDGDWQYEWIVNEEDTIQNSTAIEFNYTDFNKKQKYVIEVKRSYNEDPTKPELQKEEVITLYPHPKCPDKLTPKGNGTSGIWIAMFNDLKYDDLMNDGYSFIFKSDKMPQEVLSDKPYYQFGNNDTTQKWVYSKWFFDDQTERKSIKGIDMEGNKDEKYTRSISSDPTSITNVECGEIQIVGGRLIANVATPAPAVIDIISVSGNTLRRTKLSPSTTFNETIDFNGLPAGICIVKCTVGDKKIEQKMVIK